MELPHYGAVVACPLLNFATRNDLGSNRGIVVLPLFSMNACDGTR